MDWKKIGKKLLFPPVWLMLLLTALSAAGLTAVFLKGWEESPVAYAVYVVAFYTLSVVCVYCATVLPGQVRQIRKRVYDDPLGNRYMTDPEFRTRVSLYLSLGVNLLYVGVNVVSWALYRSWWYVCLAVYYMILSVMRFVLLRYVRGHRLGEDRRGELKSAVFCSSVLLTLNFFLSGAVLMMVYQNRGYAYHGILIYVMAMYTFFITTNAIVNLVKYRKLHSPVMTTAKVITFTAALVSMLNLETAMFAAFGQEMSQKNQQLMIMLTGAGVSVAVIALAVFMIVRSAKELKEIRSGKHGE